jgi:preprotein translocase subunit SecA
VFFVSLEDELVVRNAGQEIPPSPNMTPDGLVEDERVDWAVAHAQRVAEGINYEIHRNTWRYSVVIEQQRKALAERRERVLTTDVTAEMLAEYFPEKCEQMDPELLSRVSRTIALYHIDRLWAEHLAMLSEVREGVHLRSLARVDPLDEFHRSAVPAFNELIPEIERRTVETFESLAIDEDWQPEQAKLIRPSATWTYLVHDAPFGSEMERMFSAASKAARKRR